MIDIALRCCACESTHEADLVTLDCRACGSPLDVDYATEPDGESVRLPVRDTRSLVSLGEGDTPIVALSAAGDLLGLTSLCAKLEFMNPTGSFKDRGTSVMMSVVRERGVPEIVEDSSGNAGASVAAYAARAGVRAHIFAPADAPEGKVQQIRVYGAETHLIEGPRSQTAEAAEAYSRERGLVYASHNLSPYFIEGMKSFAYEVMEQLSRRPPDHVVMPVSNGSLFIGAWKGFEEMRSAGRASSVPRLHCVQSRVAMPIVSAFSGVDWTPEPGVRTVAGGISSPAPPRRLQSVEVLRASGGVATAVDDADILHWQRLLAAREGLYVEPTSAAAFAGLKRLVLQGAVGRDDSVLVAVTGLGLKDVPPS